MRNYQKEIFCSYFPQRYCIVYNIIYFFEVVITYLHSGNGNFVSCSFSAFFRFAASALMHSLLFDKGK